MVGGKLSQTELLVGTSDGQTLGEDRPVSVLPWKRKGSTSHAACVLGALAFLKLSIHRVCLIHYVVITGLT